MKKLFALALASHLFAFCALAQWTNPVTGSAFSNAPVMARLADQFIISPTNLWRANATNIAGAVAPLLPADTNAIALVAAEAATRAAADLALSNYIGSALAGWNHIATGNVAMAGHSISGGVSAVFSNSIAAGPFKPTAFADQFLAGSRARGSDVFVGAYRADGAGFWGLSLSGDPGSNSGRMQLLPYGDSSYYTFDGGYFAAAQQGSGYPALELGLYDIASPNVRRHMMDFYWTGQIVVSNWARLNLEANATGNTEAVNYRTATNLIATLVPTTVFWSSNSYSSSSVSFDVPADQSANVQAFRLYFQVQGTNGNKSTMEAFLSFNGRGGTNLLNSSQYEYDTSVVAAGRVANDPTGFYLGPVTSAADATNSLGFSELCVWPIGQTNLIKTVNAVTSWRLPTIPLTSQTTRAVGSFNLLECVTNVTIYFSRPFSNFYGQAVWSMQ